MATRGTGAATLAAFAVISSLLAALAASGSGVTWPVVSLAVVTGLASLWLRRRDDGTERRVCVLVLGDLGRSPRMQYHALSLSKHGYHVTFVGFSETKPHDDVLRQERIKMEPIREVKGVQVGPKIFTYVTKVILQTLQLLLVLLKMETQSHILMQNPPGLPGMAVAWLVCVLRGSRFVIDWHNYGFSIMALSLGGGHPLVRLAQWYERFFGPLAARSLCVTTAMKDDLQKNWGIRATTLYDRPASVFRETPVRRRHELFVRLADAHLQFQSSGCVEDERVEGTLFSVRDLSEDAVTLRAERPALLLSSTSWTEDEDFSVLLDALEVYEGFINAGAALPPLLCVITGRGPQKDHYMKLIDSLRLEHVKICTPWLEAEDYPVLLGSADLGVCLHKSSSGLDLPMKVVDMFGCCLPVCAVHFNWYTHTHTHTHIHLGDCDDDDCVSFVPQSTRAGEARGERSGLQRLSGARRAAQVAPLRVSRLRRPTGGLQEEPADQQGTELGRQLGPERPAADRAALTFNRRRQDFQNKTHLNVVTDLREHCKPLLPLMLITTFTVKKPFHSGVLIFFL